jgi:hypothetical protein
MVRFLRGATRTRQSATFTLKILEKRKNFENFNRYLHAAALP